MIKESQSQILQVKFTQNFFNGGGDIFKKIKKFRVKAQQFQIV